MSQKEHHEANLSLGGDNNVQVSCKSWRITRKIGCDQVVDFAADVVIGCKSQRRRSNRIQLTSRMRVSRDMKSGGRCRMASRFLEVNAKGIAELMSSSSTIISSISRGTFSIAICPPLQIATTHLACMCRERVLCRLAHVRHLYCSTQ